MKPARARRLLTCLLTSLLIASAAAAATALAVTPASFHDPVHLATGGSHTHGVALVDLNGDSKLELVAADSGTSKVIVWLGQGDGTFGGRSTYTTGTGTTPKMVAVGDLNGDGDPDLVSANQDAGSVSVLIGNGSGGFAAPQLYAACGRPHEAALGDLNGDSKLDVVVACWDDTVISVLLGNGNGTFQAKTDVQAGSAPHSVVLGRFDGDAFLDAAVADHGDGDVSILRGKGDGTFQAPVAYSVGTGPHSIRAGDFDGNGTLDLVAANDGSASVSVLLGSGTGTFAPSVPYPSGSVPKGVAVADVSGDGIPDILTANTAGNYSSCCNTGGNTISVLLGAGNGTFGGPTAYTLGTSPTSGTTPFAIATGDLNGDGDLDVATADWDSADVTILANVAGDAPPPGDTIPPVVDGVGARVGGGTVSTTSMRITVSWSAIDDDSGLASFDVFRSVDGGAATKLGEATAGARSYVATLVPGHRYAFQVRARDVAGNTSTLASTGTFQAVLYSERSSFATYQGTWAKATSTSSLGGATKRSTKIGASMTFKVNARAIAWVAPKGSTMGRAYVYVDGVYRGRIDLYATKTRSRQVVYQYSWPTVGNHTLKVVLAGPAPHPRVDIDGIIAVR